MFDLNNINRVCKLSSSFNNCIRKHDIQSTNNINNQIITRSVTTKFGPRIIKYENKPKGELVCQNCQSDIVVFCNNNKILAYFYTGDLWSN